ncbi:pirin family protein [Agaribacterium haliotis]|uniref:pirin family protein n=1 Tax=Agaribacterium haliotis TaxID=2013869 RepID=UPI000BB579B3|nr:pirin family protein [Agaribacterium haliotis]
MNKNCERGETAVQGVHEKQGSALQNKVQVKRIIKKKAGSPAYIRANTVDELKPWVLFDAGTVAKTAMDIDWHPHSGVATITLPYDTALMHEDSLGNKQTVHSRGLQYMASGSGVWHKESYRAKKTIGVLQLWLLLGPEEETNDASYMDLQPQDIAECDGVRVLLGQYRGLQSPVPVQHPVSYLHIRLKAGDHFNWQPPRKQNRGFIYVLSGELELQGTTIKSEELAQLQAWPTQAAPQLHMRAVGDSELVLALAEPWPYQMLRHYGQVHTSAEALKRGSQTIQKLAGKQSALR